MMARLQPMNLRTLNNLTKKTFMRVAVFTFAFAFAALLAVAAPPQSKPSSTGFYRLMLGDFEVAALSDGVAVRELDKLSNKPREVREALARDHETLPVALSINAFLIHTGSKLLLVDTGAGELFGERSGHLVSSLRAAGYQPGQIDAVLLTHIHGDHSGGLSIKGERVFTNALVYVDKRDLDFWLNAAEEKAAPPAKKTSFRQAHATLDPYVRADKLRPFEGAGELFPGIRAVSAYGHTPGHTAYLVESSGQRLLLWGDTIHIAESQFSDPTITVEYDVDPKAAIASRLKLLAEADKNGYLVGGEHISFPGLGRVWAEGKGYRWIAVSSSAMPLVD
ncbi:MBL fold metallo-hydrolase [Nostoc sp.]|uniref:MBL fold metallo-hydrolase n=1 Tax=Nostoc sp. TaxID=1180 RepID=UPI002FF52F86